MCDLILARIWLLGLCPFINLVLQAACLRRPLGPLLHRHAPLWPWITVKLGFCWVFDHGPGWLLFWIWVQAFWVQVVHFLTLPIGMAWIPPLCDFGKVSCQDSTESMPGLIWAFWSKQRPFWVKFGYVVPEVKWTPKLGELISNNDYGMVRACISWNRAERWRRKSLISIANNPVGLPNVAEPLELI